MINICMQTMIMFLSYMYGQHMQQTGGFTTSMKSFVVVLFHRHVSTQRLYADVDMYDQHMQQTVIMFLSYMYDKHTCSRQTGS